MLLSTFPPQTPLSDNSTFAPIFSLIYNRPRPSTFCTATAKTSQLSVANSSNSNSSTLLHHVNSTGNEAGDSGEAEPEHALVSSAAAVAAAIRKASTSPVEFVQRIEKDGAKNKALILPSSDFQRICLEQLDLFRRIVDSEALLSVYYFYKRTSSCLIILLVLVNLSDILIGVAQVLIFLYLSDARFRVLIFESYCLCKLYLDQIVTLLALYFSDSHLGTLILEFDC